MTSNLVVFQSKPDQEPDKYLIEEIELLLNQAKSGELRGIAYATVILPKDAKKSDGNSLGTGWIGVEGTADPLGMAINVLQHRYVSRVIEDSEP